MQIKIADNPIQCLNDIQTGIHFQITNFVYKATQNLIFFDYQGGIAIIKYV